MRLYELARELGVGSDQLLSVARKLGLRPKNRLGGVADDDATALRRAAARGDIPPAPPQEAGCRRGRPSPEGVSGAAPTPSGDASRRDYGAPEQEDGRGRQPFLVRDAGPAGDGGPEQLLRHRLHRRQAMSRHPEEGAVEA